MDDASIAVDVSIEFCHACVRGKGPRCLPHALSQQWYSSCPPHGAPFPESLCPTCMPPKTRCMNGYTACTCSNAATEALARHGACSPAAQAARMQAGPRSKPKAGAPRQACGQGQGKR